MKKCLSLLLSVVLLLALLPAASAEEPFVFTRDNFPVLDGSTSMVPLGQGIASVLLGETREDAADLITFHRTTQSFRNLAEGSCDLVIAAEPQSTVFEEMESSGFRWEMEPIAREALVFVVNAANPVDSLTWEQLKGIYSGSITNWSQVGGDDQPIEAFQRNASSGSQVMMEKLVMQGEEMAPAPESHVPGAMGELIDSVKSYDNSSNAIGYTVFYYASDMRMADGLKILQVDGVTPSADTIRSEQYPFRNDYYCCIDADAPADSPRRMLYDWLVSEDGQALLASEGYVSAYAPGQAPAASRVQMNDSLYVPYGGEPPVYTRSEVNTSSLTASDSYGLIYPYQGSRLYTTYSFYGEDYAAGSMWGFYTHDGVLVTEPVYTYVGSVHIDWDDPDAWCWRFTMDGEHWGFASPDGTIVSELCYDSITSIDGMLLCQISWENAEYEIYDRDLNLTAVSADFPAGCIPQEYWDGMYTCIDFSCWKYCVVENGQVLVSGKEYIKLTPDDTMIVTEPEYSGVRVYDRRGTLLIFGEDVTFDSVFHLAGSFYSVRFKDGAEAVCDRRGSVFLQGIEGSWKELDGFRVSWGDRCVWYSAEGRVLWRDIPTGWTWIKDSIFEEFSAGGLTLHDLSTGNELYVEGGSYASAIGDRIAVTRIDDGGRWHAWWVESDMTLTDANCREISILWDSTTDSQAVSLYLDSGVHVLMSLDLSREYGRGSSEVGMQGGKMIVSDERAFTCKDEEGTVLFRYPYYGLRSGD